MQMRPGRRALKEKFDSLRSWEAEHEALRDEWATETEGATLPALDAFTESVATVHREREGTAESAEALERFGAAIEALGDAQERERYVEPYNAALSALERRLGDDSPVLAAVNATLGRVEPARDEAEAEIARRIDEAARKEAREREDQKRREAEQTKRDALAEVEAALAGETGLAA